MLKVSEQLLVRETGKIRVKRNEEMQKRYNSETAGNEEESPEAPATEFQKEIMDTYSNNPLHSKEKAIIQFLLRNGDKLVQVPANEADGTPAFTETVISHLYYSFHEDGIELSHPLYKRVFEEAAQYAADVNFSPERHFITHPDSEISRLAADLCSERYMLSKFFTAQNGGEERNEMAILFEQTTRLSIAYKQSIIDEMLKETMAQMKDPAVMTDAQKAMELMENFKYLKETQQALNNMLQHYGFGSAALNV